MTGSFPSENDISESAMVQEFTEALDKLATIMTKLDKAGITCGFNTISKKANGNYSADGTYANKKLL